MNEESEKVLKSIGILDGNETSVNYQYIEALEEQKKLNEQEKRKKEKKEEKEQNG